MNRTYDEYSSLLNEYLQGCLIGKEELPEGGGIPNLLASGMNYSLLSPGKRLRGVLLLAAYEQSGKPAEEALPFAAALEMIHAYSLIHDDLPAMDNDDLRRGKPTNHKVYGEGMAILNGDGLLNAAYEIMLDAAVVWPNPTAALKAVRAIARRAGITGMIAGQCVDVTMEGQAPQKNVVEYIHAHKTADLIIAPIEAGLFLGECDDLTEAGCAYGYHLGIAFQMIDDCLDMEGDELLIGKKTGVDVARGKMTWPALVGLEETRREACRHYEKALIEAEKFTRIGGLLKAIAHSMQIRNK